MEFYVTKKGYDWIVRNGDAELASTRMREAAIETAIGLAREVVKTGGDAEVLVINTVGMWDKVDIAG